MTERRNADLARRASEAFVEGDTETVFDHFSDRITYHVAGESRISGTYRGLDEVIGLFEKLQEVTEGTFELEVEEIADNDQTAVVLTTARAQQQGRTYEWQEAHVTRWEDGRMVEWMNFPRDQHTHDQAFG